MKLLKLNWETVAAICTIYEQLVDSGRISRYGSSLDLKTASMEILMGYREMCAIIKDFI